MCAGISSECSRSALIAIIELTAVFQRSASSLHAAQSAHKALVQRILALCGTLETESLLSLSSAEAFTVMVRLGAFWHPSRRTCTSMRNSPAAVGIRVPCIA